MSQETLNLGSTVRVSPDVFFQSVGEQRVLLDARAGVYYRLNELGTRIWEALVRDGRLRQVWEGISADQEVDSTVLQRDCFQFLNHLLERGLISIVESG